MQSTVQSRMFDRLKDLVPSVELYAEGSTFFAAPRHKGDLSLYCSLVSKSDHSLKLEIAQDLADPGIPGEASPAPWMEFRVDLQNGIAELVAFQENSVYEQVPPASGPATRRSAGLNMFAVNWLNILVNMQFVFIPVAQTEMST